MICIITSNLSRKTVICLIKNKSTNVRILKSSSLKQWGKPSFFRVFFSFSYSLFQHLITVWCKYLMHFYHSHQKLILYIYLYRVQLWKKNTFAFVQHVQALSIWIKWKTFACCFLVSIFFFHTYFSSILGIIFFIYKHFKKNHIS